MASTAESRQFSIRLDSLWPFVAAAMFVVAIALLHHELAAYTYRGIMQAVAEVAPARFGWALGFTALAYAVLPGYDAMALSYIGRPLPLRRTVFGSFIAYAVSQMLGFPLVTGGSVRLRLWSSWGLSSTEIARAIGFVAFSFALGMVLLSGVVFLAEPAGTAAVIGLPIASLRPVGAIELLAVAGYAAWTFARRGRIRIGAWKVPAPRPAIVGAQLLVPALDWTLAAAALYVLLPPGHPITFVTFLGVFLIAQFTGLVSHVPGGLGVVETIMVLLLKPYIPASELLGALIAYRAVYYLLPFGVAVIMIGLHEARPYAPQALGVARSVGGWVPRLVPQVLSGAVFLTGAILLISGATPGVPGRLAWLGDVLPLGLIEPQSLRGEPGRRRSPRAAVGAVAPARRGLRIHRHPPRNRHRRLAAQGSGLGGSKRARRGARRRPSRAPVLLPEVGASAPSRSRPGWMLAILLVVGGSVWLGMFAHKHAEYTDEIWWRFALRADAPRFLRATVGVVAALLVVGLMRLFRHAPAEVELPGPADLDRAAALIDTWPDASSYLALLGDKALLFSESGNAFLMYGVEGRSWVALGDPVGPPAEQVELAWRFRELADRHGGWTVFYEVGDRPPAAVRRSRAHAAQARRRGAGCRSPTSRSTAPTAALSGARSAQMERDGVTFEVIPAGSAAPLLPELRAISDAWLEEKRTREKAFSLGRFDDAYISRFPIAVARRAASHRRLRQRVEHGDEGRAFGRPDALPARRPGRRDGVPLRRADALGQGAPGMSASASEWRRSPAWSGGCWRPSGSRVGALVFRHGEHFYNFQGLREYKEKFDPVWSPKYLASPGGLALPRILGNVAALISGGIRGVVTK